MPELQLLRDQFRGPRIYTPEGIANEICSRLSSGMIYGAYRDLHARKLQLRLLKAIAGDSAEVNASDPAKSNEVEFTVRRLLWTNLEEALVQLIADIEQMLGVTGQMLKKLEDLACEVLSGENTTIDQLAERIGLSKTLTVVCYKNLLKVAKRRTIRK
ncbi:MAG: hypothetical protein RLZZ458_2711 [Planctomycetota bacterium]